MSRSWRLYLNDIRECCLKVARYTDGMSEEQFVEDELVYDAVLRNLEIIGEATAGIPDDVRSKLPQLEWTKMKGMRNWLAHVYFGIDNEIIWDVVRNKLPDLAEAVKAFLAADDSSRDAAGSQKPES